MKKLLFLLITCFLLTGCTVNYNLNISDGSFEEKITGNVLNSEVEIKNDIEFNIYHYLINSEQTAFKNNNSIFYNKVINNENDRFDYEYSYTFNENNFGNSRLLNECFENFTFENTDTEYKIKASGKFECAYSEKTNITITTKHKVISHNADSKKKNKYTWTIEKENIDDLDLFITIDKTKKASNISIEWSTLQTVGLIIILILSGVVLFITKFKLKD